MIGNEELRIILSDWNFWDREVPSDFTGHPRDLTEKIRAIATGREVVAIIGVRRCGKTTILFQLMQALDKDGVDRRDILYVNLEDHRFALHLDIALLDSIVSFYKEEVNPAGPRYIFLDEAQEIPGWERWVRSFYDRNPSIRIFVTGSSSSMMATDLSTLLTGRNLTFLARPFSFMEHLSFFGIEITPSPDPIEAYKKNLKKRDVLSFQLREYMESGGFPEPLKSEDRLRRNILLQQYFDNILAKDIVQRHKLRNSRLLKDLALVLMSDISNLISFGRAARALGTSASSVRSLLDHIEESKLITTSRFFSFSARESVSVQKPRKVYVVDTGLRNAVIARHSPDFGRTAENLVHNHLVYLGQHPTYWRDEVEVDFVLGRSKPVPINVCFAEEIPEREVRGLKKFNERFGNDMSWIITKSAFGKKKYSDLESTLCPLWAFLLSDEPDTLLRHVG